MKRTYLFTLRRQEPDGHQVTLKHLFVQTDKNLKWMNQQDRKAMVLEIVPGYAKAFNFDRVVITDVTDTALYQY